MESTKTTKKNKLPLIIGGVAAVLVIIIAVVFMVTRPKEINLEEMVIVNCSGYDGYGTAEAALDIPKFYGLIAELKGEKDVDEDDLEDLIEDFYDMADCMDEIKLKLDKKENVSNGDKLTIKISYDNEEAKEVGLKFTGEEVTLEAEDLEPIKKINPFDDIEITYYGIAPDGYMEYTYNGDTTYYDYYSFSVDKRYDLSNGDKITFSLDIKDEQTIPHGYILTEKEHVFEVAGLESYVTSYSELSADFLATAKSEAEDTIVAYAANYYMDTVSLGELTYAGYIFNSKKPDSNSWGNTNELYIIYSGKLSDAENKFTPYTVYYPVRYSNLLSKNGEISYSDSKKIIGSCYLGNSWHGTDGYINPMLCYKELVTANMDHYTSEVGDGFEKNNTDGYLTGLADINSTYHDELAAEAKLIIENYVSTYDESTVVENLKPVGEYLLLAKTQSSNYTKNNKYIVVYSADLSSTENNFAPATVYYPVQYEGIIKMPDNSYIYMGCNGIQGSYSYFPDSWYYTNGYLDGATMFQKLVTANRNDYTYEMTEELKQFGE